MTKVKNVNLKEYQFLKFKNKTKLKNQTLDLYTINKVMAALRIFELQIRIK